MESKGACVVTLFVEVCWSLHTHKNYILRRLRHTTIGPHSQKAQWHSNTSITHRTGIACHITSAESRSNFYHCRMQIWIIMHRVKNIQCRIKGNTSHNSHWKNCWSLYIHVQHTLRLFHIESDTCVSSVAKNISEEFLFKEVSSQLVWIVVEYERNIHIQNIILRW